MNKRGEKSLIKLFGVDFYRLVPAVAPYDQSPLFYYNLLDFIQNTGKVNSIRIHVGANVQWGYFDPEYPMTKVWLQQACSEARAKGIKTLLSCFSNEGASDDAAHMADVILNVDGQGDRWIANFAQIVSECQPDAVDVMNEPPSRGDSGNPNLTFQAYRDFVVKCCTAFRAAKPDVSLYVEGLPSWKLGIDTDGTGSWATKPLTEFNDVTYEVHLYYDVGTINTPFAQAYQAGNLTQAKTLLYDAILNDIGLQSLMSKGLPITWGEVGVESIYPHWDAFLKDMYSFAKQYNQGFIQHSLAPTPPEPRGILTSDWKQLNDVGLLWKQEAPTPTPTPPIIPTWVVPVALLGTLLGTGVLYLATKKK